MVIDINVKGGEFIWNDERNGYRFVKIDDTEIFLLRSTIDRVGSVRLLRATK